MKKTIILGLPAVYGLGYLIKENLQTLDFEVIDISFNHHDFKYKNFSQRTYNFLRKTFLRDRSYKDKLRFINYKTNIIHVLESMSTKADFALIIRPDTYSEDVLNLIKGNCHRFIGYQWDGLKRYPWVENFVPLFDRFFIFDWMDLKNTKFNYLFLTNFYFTIDRLVMPGSTVRPKAYFIGAYNRNRMAEMENIVEKLNDNSYDSHIVLYSKRKKQPKTNCPQITVTHEKISYEENLKIVQESTVLLDIPDKVHNGLSLRFFEALCYEKKLITNNKAALYFDFYCKENIFIVGEDDNKRLKEFLSTPYYPLEPQIRAKYGFDNWIHYVLNLPPYTSIECPTKLLEV